MPTSKLLLACLIFAIGQTFGWFQIHSQYVWKWWEGRPIEAVLLFGFPTGLCFWYATKMAIDATAHTKDDDMRHIIVYDYWASVVLEMICSNQK